jgi:hypothetical protein
MTTKINKDLANNFSSSSLVPALGETWAHSANLRLILSWKNNRRIFNICKSSYLPNASICYKISVNSLNYKNLKMLKFVIFFLFSISAWVSRNYLIVNRTILTSRLI